MAEYNRRLPRVMSDEVLLETVLVLRRRGWGFKKIGARVGLSASGAGRAYQRALGVTEPPQPGDVDTVTAPAENW